MPFPGWDGSANQGEELFHELNACFSYFDQIMEKYNLETLKTIGDCYKCTGGIPVTNQTHAIDAVLAAMEMQLFVQLRKAQRHKSVVCAIA